MVEGLAYALAPSLVERMLELLRSLPEAARRQVGVVWLGEWADADLGRVQLGVH